MENTIYIKKKYSAFFFFATSLLFCNKIIPYNKCKSRDLFFHIRVFAQMQQSFNMSVQILSILFFPKILVLFLLE